jgi:FKBP-type peptidyl-prolyl cis-trans isomerase SlpA
MSREVALQIRISLANGSIVEDTFAAAPEKFTLGQGQLLDEIEQRAEQLQVGEAAEFELTPEQAYGDYDEARVHMMPRAQFPPELDIGEGKIVAFDTPGGTEIVGQITDLNDDFVMVDFNHPLAGQLLKIRIQRSDG